MTGIASDNQPRASRKRRWHFSRRGFLIGTGLVGGSLAVGVSLGLPRLRTQVFDFLDSGSAYGPPLDNEPWVWFEVMPDSRIGLFVNKIEMGQGIHTALAQIAVEELGLDVANIEVVQATTAMGPVDPMGTFGSMSVQSLYDPLRLAGAGLREILLNRAAAILRVKKGELQIQDRHVVGANDNLEIALWDLVVSDEDETAPKETLALKSAAEFTSIGQSVPRLDLPSKVTGQALYGYDVRLPGMKYGAVLRPPTLEGRLSSTLYKMGGKILRKDRMA